jgi:hypothetical protein
VNELLAKVRIAYNHLMAEGDFQASSIYGLWNIIARATARLKT